MFFKKYGDIVVGVFFMALSVALMIMAKQLLKSQVMEIGPDFMPMVIGVFTFILAAILTISALKNKMRKINLVSPGVRKKVLSKNLILASVRQGW